MLATVVYSVVAGWTLREIHNGGSDTHILAQAADAQAKKMGDMSTAADKIRQAAENMVAQEKRIANSAQSALNASIATARFDQRAWVGPVAIREPNFSPRQDLSVIVEIGNSGKTPALRFGNLIQIQFVGAGATFNPIYAPPPTKGSVSVLQPGMHVTVNTPTIAITQTQIDALKQDRMRLYIYGILTYADVFAKSHTTRFCAYFSGDLSGATSCDTYNEAN
jgi:hypothetical protein